jgi:O-antigen/teichoic acid export membrane protein
MKKTFGNAIYGALDYACYPVGMLLLAPVVLRHLGPAEYGLWMVATSVVSGGAIIASGFCDAGIQRLSKMHARSQPAQIENCAGSLLALTFTLSVSIAAILWIAAPSFASRLASDHAFSVAEGTTALRIASILVLVRAVEAVPVSIQRAFLQYGPSVRINVAVRFATLGMAAVLSITGSRVIQILSYSLGIMIVGLFFQFWNVRRFLPFRHRSLRFDSQQLSALFGIGVFGWLQAFGSVLFRQFDRILLGFSLGAVAVVPYTLSIQLTEPLFGLTASALSFFFPYLSGRLEVLPTAGIRRVLRNALLCNLVMVAFGAAILLCFGHQILRRWVGVQLAQETQAILALITVGSALSGLSVVGVYAAQALGLFRFVATISIVSRCILLVAMFACLHRWGVIGLAVSRLLYGAAALLVYIPVALYFLRVEGSGEARHSGMTSVVLLEEGQL